MHEYSADVDEPTCVKILQPGYKVGDRIIRPAGSPSPSPAMTAAGRAAPGDGDDEDAPGRSPED